MAEFNTKHSVDATAYDSRAVPALIEEVGNLGKNFLAGSEENARIQLVNATRKLILALETPRDTMMRHCYADVRYEPPPLFRRESRKINIHSLLPFLL